jgi:hypothetical protein
MMPPSIFCKRGWMGGKHNRHFRRRNHHHQCHHQRLRTADCNYLCPHLNLQKYHFVVASSNTAERIADGENQNQYRHLSNFADRKHCHCPLEELLSCDFARGSPMQQAATGFVISAR